MTTTYNRLALGLVLSLGFVGLAQAVTAEGQSSADPAGTRPNTNGETVTSGTISSIDVQRGLLAVSGRVYRFTLDSVTFSDDRKKPAPDGLAGVKPGTRVTVRSVGRNGTFQAIQIVARD